MIDTKRSYSLFLDCLVLEQNAVRGLEFSCNGILLLDKRGESYASEL
ncbi:MAG: hypothetical protein WC471_01145 [Candidatus Woesearchaeota archaeon]